MDNNNDTVDNDNVANIHDNDNNDDVDFNINVVNNNNRDIMMIAIMVTDLSFYAKKIVKTRIS